LSLRDNQIQTSSLPATKTPDIISSLRSPILILIDALSHPDCRATDQAPYGSAGALNTLLADWNRIGFSTPSKPAQYRIYGRDGHVTNGPDYNAMVTLIRLALEDSREGRDQAALAKVSKVRSLLDR
jgi:hypothetical protein